MIRVGLLLVISAGAMMGLVLLLGNRFVFYPSRYPEGRWDHDLLNEAWTDETFHAPDGVKLHGWWAPADAEHTLLWMHGNSGNVTHRVEELRTIHGYGVRVFLFDYRGYGKSEGTPHEEGVYRDARAAFDHLVEEKDVSPEQLYLFGRSMGGAVATRLATEVECGGLILQSTFTSIRDMAGASLPIPLLHLCLGTTMDSRSRIASIDMPLMVIHGGRDEIVPVRLGRQLFEAGENPKTWLEIEGAGHDEVIESEPDRYRDTLLRFMEDPDAVCASEESSM